MSNDKNAYQVCKIVYCFLDKKQINCKSNFCYGEANMKPKHIFNVNGLDILAANYSGSRPYYIDIADEQKMIGECIPENLENITDMEEIKTIHKNIMHTMNVLWSSTGGVPTFPEQWGKKTRWSRGTHGMVFCGRGWMVNVFYSYEKYKTLSNILIKESIKKMDELPVDEHFSKKSKELIDPIVNMLGVRSPIS